MFSVGERVEGTRTGLGDRICAALDATSAEAGQCLAAIDTFVNQTAAWCRVATNRTQPICDGTAAVAQARPVVAWAVLPQTQRIAFVSLCNSTYGRTDANRLTSTEIEAIYTSFAQTGQLPAVVPTGTAAAPANPPNPPAAPAAPATPAAPGGPPAPSADDEEGENEVESVTSNYFAPPAGVGDEEERSEPVRSPSEGSDEGDEDEDEGGDRHLRTGWRLEGLFGLNLGAFAPLQAANAEGFEVEGEDDGDRAGGIHIALGAASRSEHFLFRLLAAYNPYVAFGGGKTSGGFHHIGVDITLAYCTHAFGSEDNMSLCIGAAVLGGAMLQWGAPYTQLGGDLDVEQALEGTTPGYVGGGLDLTLYLQSHDSLGEFFIRTIIGGVGYIFDNSLTSMPPHPYPIMFALEIGGGVDLALASLRRREGSISERLGRARSALRRAQSLLESNSTTSGNREARQNRVESIERDISRFERQLEEVRDEINAR